MMIGERHQYDDARDAIDDLLRMRAYAPYKFSGQWFVGIFNGQAYAYRSLASIRRAMEREGEASAAVMRIG